MIHLSTDTIGDLFEYNYENSSSLQILCNLANLYSPNRIDLSRTNHPLDLISYEALIV